MNRAVHNTLRRVSVGVVTAMSLTASVSVFAAGFPDFGSETTVPGGTGWAGFANTDLLVKFLTSLSLASVLGWFLAWSPRQTRYLERMSGAASSTVLVLYAVIGATLGALVTRYGMGVGLVVFGIGGLTRFRSNVGTPESTGRLIAATIVGLCTGLELPHVAVSTTLFLLGVLWLANRRVAFRLLVKGLAPEVLAEAAKAHRETMDRCGCVVLGEKKNFLKGQVAFLFRAPPDFDPEQLRQTLRVEVSETLHGAVDWDIG